MKRIVLTQQEKEIIASLKHNLYTVEYLEEWLNRNDNVFANPVAALNAMAAKGYYDAVKSFARNMKEI